MFAPRRNFLRLAASVVGVGLAALKLDVAPDLLTRQSISLFRYRSLDPNDSRPG